jgi:hypothetical protein
MAVPRAAVMRVLLVVGRLAMPPAWTLSPFRRQPPSDRWIYQCPKCDDKRDFARRQKKTPHCRNDGAFMRLISEPGR